MSTVKYDKIIRDNIPEIIENTGKTCKTRIVSGEEKTDYLLKKVYEEMDEFIEAKNVEEMADVLEVIDAIIDSLNLNRANIEKVRTSKAYKNGKFEKGLVLEEVRSED